jgi:hypothetical protein
MKEADANQRLRVLDLLGDELRQAASQPIHPYGKAVPMMAMATLIAIAAAFALFTGPGKAVAQDVGEFLGIANPDNRADIREINDVLAIPGQVDEVPTEATPELLDGCARLLNAGEYNVPCIEILGRDAPERLPTDIPRP